MWKSLQDFYLNYYQFDVLIDFLTANGLMKKEMYCPSCKNPEPMRAYRKTLVFRCRKMVSRNKRKKVRCDVYISAKRGTFFENTKLPIQTVMTLVSHFLYARRPRLAFTSENTQCTKKTVIDWECFCREVCVYWCAANSTLLGGPGQIVEIDEAKFGKKKYNKGPVIAGQWILVGFDRESNKAFFDAMPKRDNDSLLDAIKRHILPGTTVVSHCWKSYDCLADEGFVQHKINHGLNFVDPSDSSVGTQNIGLLWRDARGSLPSAGRSEAHLEGYLAEFIFKKANKGNLLGPFLETMKSMYPGV